MSYSGLARENSAVVGRGWSFSLRLQCFNHQEASPHLWPQNFTLKFPNFAVIEALGLNCSILFPQADFV